MKTSPASVVEMIWNKMNYVFLLSLLVIILQQVNGLRPRNGNQFRTRAPPKNVARTGFLSTGNPQNLYHFEIFTKKNGLTFSYSDVDVPKINPRKLSHKF